MHVLSYKTDLFVYLPSLFFFLSNLSVSVCDNISMGHVGASHVYIGALGNSLGGGGGGGGCLLTEECSSSVWLHRQAIKIPTCIPKPIKSVVSYY